MPHAPRTRAPGLGTQGMQAIRRTVPTGGEARRGLARAVGNRHYHNDLEDLQTATSQAEKADNEQEQHKHLQKALAALHRASAEDPTDDGLHKLAGSLQKAVTTIMEEAGAHKPAPLRHQRVPEWKSWQKILDETQLVLDHATRKTATKLHTDAYSDAGEGGELAHLKDQAAFQKAVPPPVDTSHLDAKTQAAGLGDTFEGAVERCLSAKGAANAQAHSDLTTLKNFGQTEFSKLSRRRAALHGEALGLHPAERAAIVAYTSQDFLYVNPSVGGNNGWLRGATKTANPTLHGAADQLSPAQLADRADRVDRHMDERTHTDIEFDQKYQKKRGTAWRPKGYAPGTTREQVAADHLDKAQEADLNSVRREGAELSAMAIQGLAKLPVFKGKTYRNERLSPERLAQWFRIVGPGRLAPRTGYFVWPSFVSTSMASNQTFGQGDDPHPFRFELKVNDGRDLRRLSSNTAELEVLLLPGATIKIDSVRVTSDTGRFGILKGDMKDNRATWEVTVTGHQVANGSGGSATAPAAEPTAAPSGDELAAAAHAKAKELIEAAGHLEPLVTADVKAFAKQAGGRTTGLEHRVKTIGSLERKLHDRGKTAAATAKTPEQKIAFAMTKVMDVLRYTVVLPPKSYATASGGLPGWFKGKNYEARGVFDGWSESATYKGRNYSFNTRALGGQRLPFEVQAHTTESRAATKKNHADYEEQRAAGTSPARAQAVTEQMEDRAARVPVPVGVVQNKVADRLKKP